MRGRCGLQTHGEWCLQQVDGADTDKRCGKWQIEIKRSQVLGERCERPGVCSQEV